MSRRALITGITGQDGAYLAALLLAKGYVVHGTYRPTSSLNTWRLRELDIEANPNLHLHEHDLCDLAGSYGLLEQSRPDEVYNLAAQSFVGLSFRQPVATAQITGIGAINLLEAVRVVAPKARYYQASSSEMFGGRGLAPLNEHSRLDPRSPYAVAKCFAHMATLNYREAYGLYAVSGILFNHESPLRSPGFLTRKVSESVARIHLGRGEMLSVGNVDACRDWGYAREYVDGIWRMLQAPEADSYVLATGQSHSVREFIDCAFESVGRPLEWQGEGVERIAVDTTDGKPRVRIDASLYRPADPERVTGDPSHAAKALDWRPATDLSTLAAIMVKADIQRLGTAR